MVKLLDIQTITTCSDASKTITMILLYFICIFWIVLLRINGMWYMVYGLGYMGINRLFFGGSFLGVAVFLTFEVVIYEGVIVFWVGIQQFCGIGSQKYVNFFLQLIPRVQRTYFYIYKSILYSNYDI